MLTARDDCMFCCSRMSRRCDLPRRRDLSESDIAVWDAFARSVRALPGRRLPAAALAKTHAPERAPTPPSVIPIKPLLPRSTPLIIGEQPAGVDNATWRRLRSGRLRAERSLDLHGHTAQHAYSALERLLHSARADGLRVVEVITGRGAGENGGVLRREVPLWLNLPHMRTFVLAAAHPHSRNTGAIRVLLRRG